MEAELDLGTRFHARALAQRSVLWTVLLAPAMLLAAGAFVSVRIYPQLVTEHWLQYVLHEAFLNGWRFGHDVVFTFGPWGFVMTGFHPGTAGLTLLLRTAIAATCLAMLWRSIETSSGRRPLAVAAIALLAFVAHVCWSEAWFLLLPLLLLLEGFERGEGQRSPLYFALIAAAALAGLGKFSILVMTTVAVLAVAADELRRRSFPWTVAVYALALEILWLLAGQRQTDLPSFVRGSLELASGYGEAMALDDRLYSARSFVPFLISALLFTLLLAIVELRRSVSRGLLFLGGWSALLLLLFKSAFVRADHFHIAPAAGALLVIQFTYLTMRIRRERRLVPLLLAVPMVFSLHVVELFGTQRILDDVAGTVIEPARSLAALAQWPSYRAELIERHREAVSASPPPAKPLRGDTYPAPLGVIERPGFTYEPRPVYVSYAAYTPALAQRNAQHLLNARPPHVLFAIDPIDHQLPSLQDGASWPILLAQYQVAGQLGGHVILERRAAPASAALTHKATLHARLGKKVHLPAQPRIFTRFTIDLTTRGKLERTFYRTPPLQIRLGLAGGTEKIFRFSRGMAATELLLSPLVTDRAAFAALYDATRAQQHVQWIVIEPKEPAAAASYRPTYRIEVLAPR